MGAARNEILLDLAWKRRELLPVFVTFLCSGVGRWALLFGATRGPASSSADNIVAGFAIGLRLLVIGSTGLGLRSLLHWSDVLGASTNLRSRRGLRLRLGVVVPANLFFVFGIGAC